MRPVYQVLGACVLLASGWVDGAQGAILCKAKDGTVKVRDTANCPRHESRIDPASLGLQGPAGPPGPKGPQGPQGIQGIPGPAAKLHPVLRTTLFPIDYDQGEQRLKASCLLGEIIIGTSGAYTLGTSGRASDGGSRYDFNGNVWSFSELWPDIPGPNVEPLGPPDSPEIDLVCLSLLP
jgi:hypothetical protein